MGHSETDHSSITYRRVRVADSWLARLALPLGSEHHPVEGPRAHRRSLGAHVVGLARRRERRCRKRLCW
jgi:hypothetical protein